MSEDDEIRFEWDPNKAKTNFEKHGVTFEEATTVFYDDNARIDDDPDHSIGEHRELICGLSVEGRLLLVSFTERGDSIRIIHARQAARKERRRYEEDLIL
ncbi:MAG: BrnT family toxin [Acidobacteriota bacterium]